MFAVNWTFTGLVAGEGVGGGGKGCGIIGGNAEGAEEYVGGYWGGEGYGYCCEAARKNGNQGAQGDA